MRRVRRSDCSRPGLRRVGRGRGFQYLDAAGRPIDDPDDLERLSTLAIPPAWKDVWICSDPWGHLQATGLDAAGRKQYLYHPRWRERRDREKFERMLRFGAALPRLRRRMRGDLGGSEPTRERVLACAVRLLDIGLFRVGSEQYAEEDHGVGLATLRKEHVAVNGKAMVFDYPGKGGRQRVQVIEDQVCRALVLTLKRRRGRAVNADANGAGDGDGHLLAYRARRGWALLRAEDINDYIKDRLGGEFSAKDFRTWNATVLAAVVLATDGADATTKTARKRAGDRAVRAVAELLGNTPAVARRAYIDPRVFDRYLAGFTIDETVRRLGDFDPAEDRFRNRLERAVLGLLAD